MRARTERLQTRSARHMLRGGSRRCPCAAVPPVATRAGLPRAAPLLPRLSLAALRRVQAAQRDAPAAVPAVRTRRCGTLTSAVSSAEHVRSDCVRHLPQKFQIAPATVRHRRLRNTCACGCFSTCRGPCARRRAAFSSPGHPCCRLCLQATRTRRCICTPCLRLRAVCSSRTAPRCQVCWAQNEQRAAVLRRAPPSLAATPSAAAAQARAS